MKNLREIIKAVDQTVRQEVLVEFQATDSHNEAIGILKRHTTENGVAAKGPKLHVADGGVESGKVAHLHTALERAGFKKHAEKTNAFKGASADDGKNYHHFVKGSTNVFVSSRPNVQSFSNSGNHHVEVHTS